MSDPDKNLPLSRISFSNLPVEREITLDGMAFMKVLSDNHVKAKAIGLILSVVATNKIKEEDKIALIRIHLGRYIPEELDHASKELNRVKQLERDIKNKTDNIQKIIPEEDEVNSVIDPFLLQVLF